MSRKWEKSGTGSIRIRLPGGRPALNVPTADWSCAVNVAGSVMKSGEAQMSFVPSSNVT